MKNKTVKCSDTLFESGEIIMPSVSSDEEYEWYCSQATISGSMIIKSPPSEDSYESEEEEKANDDASWGFLYW